MSEWYDVANKMPSDERPVWAGILDSSFGAIVIEARYHWGVDSWTIGQDESERELKQVVYCWREIEVPELPEWFIKMGEQDEETK